MVEGKRQSDQRTPGVADDDRCCRCQAGQTFWQTAPPALLPSRSGPRPLAVPESRPIEDNGAVRTGGVINNATDQHVLDHRAVAVQEHNRRTVTLVHVVQPDAIDGHEPALGQIIALGLGSPAVDQDSRSGESDGGDADKTAGARGGARSHESRF